MRTAIISSLRKPTSAIRSLSPTTSRTRRRAATSFRRWQPSGEIVEGLKIRTQLNYNYSTSVQDVYNASNTSQEAHDMNGIAQMNNSLSQDVLSETYVTFQRTLPTGTTCRSWRDTPSTTTWAGRSALRPMISVNDALGNENMGAGNPRRT